MALHNMDPKRCPMPSQDPNVRNKNFKEVALGYTPEMAVNEAKRCLGCKNKPCQTGCPVGIDIPSFIAKVAEEDFEGAYQVLSASSALPARKEEVEHAEEEGIIFKLLTNPVRVLGDENGCVTGMECVEMELGEPDDSGRRRPVEKKDSNFVLDVDTMIMSIGTSPNPLIRSTTPGLETNRHGCIVTNGDDGLTSREGVYAGGDAVTGAATVILAMGAGKHAAKAIDEYIKSKNK